MGCSSLSVKVSIVQETRSKAESFCFEVKDVVDILDVIQKVELVHPYLRGSGYAIMLNKSEIRTNVLISECDEIIIDTSMPLVKNN